MLNIPQIVEKTVKKYGTSDPFEICDRMDIKVIRQELPDNVNGFFVKILKNYVIILNESCPHEFSRFVLAHELGHIIIHGGTNSIDMRLNTNLCVEKHERQADCFAGCLLLKYSGLCNDAIDGQVTSEMLSMVTGVPEDVVRSVLL